MTWQICYLPSAERMVASGVSEVKTPGFKLPFTDEREKQGPVLLSDRREDLPFLPLDAVQAVLGEGEGPWKR